MTQNAPKELEPREDDRIQFARQSKDFMTKRAKNTHIRR